METALTPPTGLAGNALLVLIALVGLLGTVIPSILFWYIEPRGRRQWGIEGDSAANRRAPFLVRATAWLSFFVGQLAVPWLIVPGVCTVLLYLQVKLGIVRPAGMAVTVGVGGAALLQALLAMRLWPLGVKLLMRDGHLCSTLARRSRTNAFVSLALLGAMSLLGWAMFNVPHFVHPWLRPVLLWTAVRPVRPTPRCASRTRCS
jgi:hypothetical protein